MPAACGFVGSARHSIPPTAGAHRQPPGEGAFLCWLSPRSKSSGWRRGWRNFPRAHHRCCSLVSKGNAAYAMTDACPSRPHQLRDPPAASNPNPGGTMPPRCRVPPKRGDAEQQTPVHSLPTGRGQLSASGCSNPARVSAEPGTQAASPPPSQGRDLGAWSSSRAGGGQGLQPPPPLQHWPWVGRCCLRHGTERQQLGAEVGAKRGQRNLPPDPPPNR